MRRSIASILLMLFTQLQICYGQSELDYFIFRYRADSSLRVSNYIQANKFYTKAAHIETYKTITDEFLVGYTYLLIDSLSLAEKYLVHAVDQGFAYNDTSYYISKYKERGIFIKMNKSKKLLDVRDKLLAGTLKKMRNEIEDSTLLNELLKRKNIDQQFRTIKNVPDSLWNSQMTGDKDNQIWLKGIIQKKGWPGYRLVGYEGSNAAWLIAQHSDLSLEFQEFCLKYIQHAYYLNDISNADYAYLIDRLRINKGQKQIFGTQFFVEYNKDGNPEIIFKPIEDDKDVDLRRRQLGIMNLADYKKYALNWIKSKPSK